jgi:hypothetical protein
LRPIAALVLLAACLAACKPSLTRAPIVQAASPAVAAAPSATPTVAIAPSSAAPASPPATAATVSSALITGAVRVPANLLGLYAAKIISGNVANIVPTGGGNVIPTGGGNLIPTGGGHYALLGLENDTLGGAKVYLADAGGAPIPGLPAVTTDANGVYTIPNVPAGFTFVVAVEVPTKDGKTAVYQTLVRSTPLGATADIDAASTLVSASVVRDVKGGNLGDVNPAKFRTAQQTAADALTPDALPDFTSRADVLARIDALAAGLSALKQSIDDLRQDISDIKQSLEDIKAQLAKQAAQQQASPTPILTSGPPQGGGLGPTSGPVLPGAPPPSGAPPASAAPTATPIPPPAPPPPLPTPPPGGCPAPALHYLKATFNGGLPPAGCRVQVSRPVPPPAAPGTRETLFDVPLDAQGAFGATVPTVCYLIYTLEDASNRPIAILNFAVDGSQPDSADHPQVVPFKNP